MPKCRPLVLSDIPWVVQELRALPKQSEYFADVPDDVDYVKEQLTNYMLSGVLIGVTDNYSPSFLLATVNRPWYANRVEVHEMMFWVPESIRGSSTGLRLIKEYVELAKTYAPHSIHAGVSLDIVDADRVLALYEAAGFKRDKHGVVMRP